MLSQEIKKHVVELIRKHFENRDDLAVLAIKIFNIYLRGGRKAVTKMLDEIVLKLEASVQYDQAKA
ncbi:MAG: hypothetical protein DRJ32_00130 [Thermoprotei archaeon]|nr:MAG: hypothetical protein B6U94_05855 [Thermofilum sp. ex4484_79]RLE61825.1 MAG: hypothetical protein DRJ32_00130 [Thermoprotei archaeon]